MDRLLYVAMGGGKQLMQAQTVVSNNLANVSTQGFRAALARFDQMPVEGFGYPTRVNVTTEGLGFDHKPGTMVHTGNVLDVAVEGNGWIAVQAPDGTEAYTRDGSFSINSQGQKVDRIEVASAKAFGTRARLIGLFPDETNIKHAAAQ